MPSPENAIGRMMVVLRSRGVFAVAAAYLVAAAALVQVVSAVVPALHLPDWVNTLTVVAAALGFPVALVLAWMYRWTPQGIERDAPAEGVQRPPLYAAIAVTLVVAAGLVAWTITRGIAHPTRARPAAHGDAGSVAVLRCENQADATLDYLAQGLAEEVAARMSRLAALKVVVTLADARAAMSATTGLRGFGEQYDVEHVLACSLRPGPEGLRVSVRLVEARSGTQEWSESFDGARDELIRTIDAIAISAADHLLEKLVGTQRAQLVRHRTNDPEALDLFLRAHLMWQDWTRGKDAVALLDQALELDPNFALAHIEKIAASETQFQFGSITREEMVALIDRNLAAARAIDPELPEAYAWELQRYAQYELDVERATQAMRRALALDPNSPYVLYPACQAGWSLRFDSAGHCERWRALRPDDPFAWVNVSGAYKYQRDFPRAIAEAEAAMARHPNDWLAPWLKSHSEMALGRCGDAIASLERALELDPRRTQDVLSIYSAALQCAGRREEAARIAAEIPPVDPKYAPDPNVYLVPYHAARGELELAWRVCEAALARKWFMGYECLASHWLDGMRDDPRFIEQERRVGLSPLPRQLRVDPKLWMRPVRHSENGA